MHSLAGNRSQQMEESGSMRQTENTLWNRIRPVAVAMLAIAFCLLLAGSSNAQLSTAERPVSFSVNLRSSLPDVTMDEVDVDALLSEDELEMQQGKDIPLRFGFPFDVDYTLDNSGTWETLPDGSRIWRLRIVAPGAKSINLLYDYYWLPEGATLHLYNEDNSLMLGAFTSQNNKEHGQMATGLVKGEVTILEYFEPSNVRGLGIINISRVVHGYRDMFKLADSRGYGSSGSCNNNVHCPEADDWQLEVRSVAMVILSSGTRWCSGSMVNNVTEDQTPYFLTANHCLGSESSWIIMFNYQSPICQNQNGPTWMTVQGTTKLANYSTSDFGLLLLTEAPPDSYNVYYAGWSAINIAPQSEVGIHHPAGDIKKISWDYDAATTANYLQNSGTTHWRIIDWDDGTTEGGSSGSPLYDQNHRVIGQLHGGYASCVSQTSDWYGKFSLSWTGGGSPSNQLKYWLDPGNTGATTLDGFDPFGGTRITYDVPLEDTRDTVTDYSIICLISSNTDLVVSELLVNYRIDTGLWVADTLVTTLEPDEFEGFIAAQAPGTVIDYYLSAIDINDVADTTSTFTFRVIDFGVEISPRLDTLLGAVDDTVWYNLTATNTGVYDDDYTLVVSGNTWLTALFDASQTVPVSATGTLTLDQTFDFTVRVVIPSSLYGDFDMAAITVTSTTNSMYSDVSNLRTVSVGEPLTIPFEDEFPSTTIDIAKWVEVTGAIIDDRGIGEPSEPYSLNLNGNPGGQNTILSQAIDLSGESNVILRYSFEQTGGGDPPESGDDLTFEFYDNTGAFQLLTTHVGSDPDMTSFQEVEITLPPSAYHSAFALRITSVGTVGSFDDWFVDDVYIGYPPDYDVSVTPYLSSQYGPADASVSYSLTVHNKGALDDVYDLSVSDEVWSVSLFDSDGVTPISATSTVTAGDSVTFIARVDIPAATPTHDADTASVIATSQGNVGVSDDATVITLSAGVPGIFPWFEDFPYDTLVTERWLVVSGATVSTSGLNLPSEPYSFNFVGDNDTAVSQPIDLSGQSGVVFSYHYQRGGASDPPETGDDLTVEYKNDLGVWSIVNVHAGSGSVMAQFEPVYFGLPTDAEHDGFQIRIHNSGSGTTNDNWFVDDIRLDYPPNILVAPSSIAVNLQPDDSTVAELIISNSGVGDLYWNSSIVTQSKSGRYGKLFDLLSESGEVAPATREVPEALLNFVDSKGSQTPAATYSVDKSAGGPDNFGYFWIDSDETGGPLFAWEDISGTGTDIIGDLTDDNYTGPLDLGFGFEFYGSVYTQIYVGSNGIIGFNPADMNSRFKTAIPNASTPNNMLAWLWDDLNPVDADNLGGHVYVDTSGGRCVISFVDYPEYGALPGELITAQVILEPTGAIKYQYLSIDPGFDAVSGAVGIENSDGTDGLEIVFAGSYLKDSLAIIITPPIDWLSIEQVSGTLVTGEADTVEVKLNSDGLEDGTYDAVIQVSSNDPDSLVNPWSVPVALTVSTGPDTTVPVISNLIITNVGVDSATISWETNEPSSTRIEYGLDAAYGSSTTEDPTLTYVHSQTITGLSGGTLYHARAISTDAAANTGTSSDTTFTTEIGYICGDINNSGDGPDVSDLTYLVDYLFAGGAAPEVPEAADVDGSGGLDVSDLTYMVDYLFGGGPAPVCGG